MMPRALKKIAFVVEEFSVLTPAQQLLDRFLIGYPRDGTFHRIADCEVHLHIVGGMDSRNAFVEQRIADFKLVDSSSIESAVKGADAIVVVWRGGGTRANDFVLRRALESATKG